MGFIRRIRILDFVVIALVIATVVGAGVSLSLSTHERALAQEITNEPEATASPSQVVDVPPVIIVQPTAAPSDGDEPIFKPSVSFSEVAVYVTIISLVFALMFISRTAIVHAAAGVPKSGLDIIYSLVDSLMKSGQEVVDKSETKIDNAALAELRDIYQQIREDITKQQQEALSKQVDPSFLPKGGDLSTGVAPNVPPSNNPVG